MTPEEWKIEYSQINIRWVKFFSKVRVFNLKPKSLRVSLGKRQHGTV